MEIAYALSPEEKSPCGCKSPFAGSNRIFCAPCLNRNLERACQKTFAAAAVLSPGTRGRHGGTPRAFYPGMPRAALRLVEQVSVHDGPPVEENGSLGCSSGGSRTGLNRQACVDGEKDSHRMDISSNEIDQCRKQGTKLMKVDSVVRPENRVPTSSELQMVIDLAEEKKHMSQMRKNLTVRVRGAAAVPAAATSSRPENCQSSFQRLSLKEAQSRKLAQPSKARKWMMKPDAAAEAELMRRLLSDSVPVVKAPLVLPLCRVRPAPLSPISPPGDPLWKRRCVPCPKVLRIQLPPPIVVK